MKNKEFIERWGIEAFEKWQKQVHDWKLVNSEKVRHYQECQKKNNRKGGKLHLNHLIYNRTGLQGLLKRVRNKYQKRWQKYKHIIAPSSQLNYLWIPGSDEYKCIALVEKDQSQYPFNDVIHIPVFHRGRIAKYLISKHILREQLMSAFANEELQAGV